MGEEGTRNKKSLFLGKITRPQRGRGHFPGSKLKGSGPPECESKRGGLAVAFGTMVRKSLAHIIHRRKKRESRSGIGGGLKK